MKIKKSIFNEYLSYLSSIEDNDIEIFVGKIAYESGNISDVNLIERLVNHNLGSFNLFSNIKFIEKM